MTKAKINKHEKSDADDDENESDDDDHNNQQSHGDNYDDDDDDEEENDKSNAIIEYKYTANKFEPNYPNDSINSNNSQYAYNSIFNNNNNVDQQTYNTLPTIMINGGSTHVQQHVYTWMKDSRQNNNANMIFSQQQQHMQLPAMTMNNSRNSPQKLNQNGTVNFYFDKSSPTNINETHLSTDSGSSPTISSTNNNTSSCLSANQSDSLVSITGKTS